MGSGPKFKPPELKILRMSSQRAEKLIKKKSPTPGPLAEAPKELTAEQKADWDYAVENAPRDVLRKIDKAVLAGFIIAQDIWRKAAVQLQRTELLVKSPTQGLPIQNPYLPIINRQLQLMIRAAAELGFTPCARARIDAGKPSDAAPVGDWEDIANG